MKRDHFSPVLGLRESPEPLLHILRCSAALSQDPEFIRDLSFSFLKVTIYLTLRIKVVPQIEKGIPCCEALLENLLKVEFCCLVVCHFTEVSSRHSTLKICQQPEENPGQDQPKETNFDLGELLVALRATLRAWTTNLPGTRANALPESMISICRNSESI